MRIWKLKSGADRRVRGGHPWIFSNELIDSPKGHDPAIPIELQDHRGQFVAYGYGNPASLIAFRAMSFASHQPDFFKFDRLVEKVLAAWKARFLMGYRYSFRVVFGEGDFFPGLVLDRYVTEDNGVRGQVLVAQILTGGAQGLMGPPDVFFRRVADLAKELHYSEFGWERTAVVIRNDVAVRKLEGLSYDSPKILHDPSALLTNENTQILLHSPWQWEEAMAMTADLKEGQKTGFFLDQSENIQIVSDLVRRFPGTEPLRVLDLCCYVGQWSSKISLVAEKLGRKANCTLVDVSESALKMAKENVQRHSTGVTETLKMDIMEDLPRLADQTFDIVIADPPAFVKAKKDLPTGTHAYLKLNTQGFRLLRSGGLLVSCSCSGLFREEDLIEVLAKAARRDSRDSRCVAKGGHAPDHPMLMSFPEGHYLKMFVHQTVAAAP